LIFDPKLLQEEFKLFKLFILAPQQIGVVDALECSLLILLLSHVLGVPFVLKRVSDFFLNYVLVNVAFGYLA
jgi:hypothetical protein